MNVKPFSPRLSVRPQVEANEVAALAARGFKSIIGNRPEGGALDQPAWSLLVAEAKRHGMSARQFPVIPGNIDPEDVKQFAQALCDLPKPIAAFCRTGTRSAMLRAFANPDRLNVYERIAGAAAQGYDLLPLHDRVEH